MNFKEFMLKESGIIDPKSSAYHDKRRDASPADDDYGAYDPFFDDDDQDAIMYSRLGRQGGYPRASLGRSSGRGRVEKLPRGMQYVGRKEIKRSLAPRDDNERAADFFKRRLLQMIETYCEVYGVEMPYDLQRQIRQIQFVRFDPNRELDNRTGFYETLNGLADAWITELRGEEKPRWSRLVSYLKAYFRAYTEMTVADYNRPADSFDDLKAELAAFIRDNDPGFRGDA